MIQPQIPSRTKTKLDKKPNWTNTKLNKLVQSSPFAEGLGDPTPDPNSIQKRQKIKKTRFAETFKFRFQVMSDLLSYILHTAGKCSQTCNKLDFCISQICLQVNYILFVE